MIRKSAFIKVSGDLYDSPDFIDQVRELSKRYFVVVCVGGGTQINKMLADKGIDLKPHGPLGRELETLELREEAERVLRKNQTALQDILAEKGIVASVKIPFLTIGSVLCPVNGDQFLQTVYLGFDQLFVVTTKDRIDAKKEKFVHLPKIEIIGIDYDE